MASISETAGTAGLPRGRSRQVLASCVQDALGELGSKYAREGVRVFLFGSIARSWPEAPLGADFDVGYVAPSSPVASAELRRRLEDDLAALPSIRPVDLVDFSQASEPFRTLALQCTIDLAHVHASPAAS